MKEFLANIPTSAQNRDTCTSIKLTENQVYYSVDRVDVALEMEQWAEQAVQANAAHLACFSKSSATSTISTLYSAHAQDGPQDME